MEDKKYYIPKLEEFHIEFEYQLKDVINDELWSVETFDEKFLPLFSVHPPSIKSEIEDNNIRIKYLDKEDIESLGFIESPRGGRFDIKDLEGEEVQMYLHDNLDEGFWYIELYDWDSQYLFRGNIKNKSELKRILTQLEIDYDI